MLSTVVTGAGGGIGEALVRAALARGDNVTALTRRLASDTPAGAVALDLADAVAVEHAAAALAAALPAVRLLVNNAAVCDHARVISADEAFQVNVAAPAALAAALAPALAAGGGVVLNVSSGDGELAFLGSEVAAAVADVGARGGTDVAAALEVLGAGMRRAEREGYDGAWGVHGGQPAYRLSKACLNAVTRVLARAAEGRFTVVAVCPGDVRTRMGCADADREPGDVAEDLLALAECGTLVPGQFYRDGLVIPR